MMSSKAIVGNTRALNSRSINGNDAIVGNISSYDTDDESLNSEDELLLPY